MNNTAPPIYGLVLSGGKSSRMGRDKSTIVVHGTTQREYLFAELNAVCQQTFISTKQEGLNSIADSFDINSPLNGILSAFKFAPDKAWLSVAVDMPYVDRRVLQLLISVRDPAKLATCFFNKETVLPEPLLTIWEPSAFDPLKKFVNDGQVSPRDFLSSHNICVIDPPDPRVFYNMNRPEDIV